MRKRTQVRIIGKHMADAYYLKGSKYPQLDVTPADVFAVSENHVFRNESFVITRPEANKIGELEDIHYGKFMVLRNDGKGLEPSKDTRPDDILDFGVQVNFVADKEGNTLADVYGVQSFLYKRVLRSASQFRTAKMLMTQENIVKDVRTHASYGWVDRLENTEVKSVSKVEPYVSLALSSSVAAGTGYTDINISDFSADISIKGALTMQIDPITSENKIVRYDEIKGKDTISMDLSDDASIISPSALARACFEAGIIYKSDFRIIKGAYNQGFTFSEQLTDAIVGPIWAKIPSAIQFRYGLKKGLAVVLDHAYVDPNDRQYDFVFPDGANKGEVKRYVHTFKDGEFSIEDEGVGALDSEVELAIAGVSSTKEKYWGMLNYQFIASLDLDFTNDLKPLATKAFNEILKGLDSPENAMAFIGMIDGGDEESYNAQNEAQRIREMLNANPRVFYTKWMQKKIKSLMEKKIQRMRKGRIPLEDARFVYMTADLEALNLDSQPLLAAGEFYYNGQTGERAIFRSPLIDKSEATKITLVTSPELEAAYGHIKNVLVMNLFDDTLPRMGGANL